MERQADLTVKERWALADRIATTDKWLIEYEHQTTTECLSQECIATGQYQGNQNGAGSGSPEFRAAAAQPGTRPDNGP